MRLIRPLESISNLDGLFPMAGPDSDAFSFNIVNPDIPGIMIHQPNVVV